VPGGSESTLSSPEASAAPRVLSASSYAVSPTWALASSLVREETSAAEVQASHSDNRDCY